MAREFSEQDLLLPFEQPRLRREYREFFKAKRSHFLKTICYFSELWDSFQDLDEIWEREVQGARRPAQNIQILPTQLLILAHCSYRVAGELVFSGCIGGAWAVMRNAVEFGVHARQIHLRPELARIWLHKDDGKNEREAFEREFWYDKKTRLFQGLDQLYEYWTLYSEWGSHSTAATIALRTKFREEAGGTEVEVSYLEGDESRMALSLHWFLDAGWQLANIMFEMFKTRFELDVPLLQMRAAFEKRHSALREAILVRYGRDHGTTVNFSGPPGI